MDSARNNNHDSARQLEFRPDTAVIRQDLRHCAVKWARSRVSRLRLYTVRQTLVVPRLIVPLFWNP